MFETFDYPAAQGMMAPAPDGAVFGASSLLLCGFHFNAVNSDHVLCDRGLVFTEDMNVDL